MGTCEQSGCRGHLGKFSSCLDEALWELSAHADATTGDVDAYGWFGLVLNPEASQWALSYGPTVEIPAGSYIAKEDSNGFVSVDTFNSEVAAKEAFASHAAEYNAWGQHDRM